MASPALARLRALCAERGIAAPGVISGRGPGYRHRARLMVRGRASSPKIGIFEEGSHRIVDIPRCVVHHPLVNDVACTLKRVLKATRTPPYSEVAHEGLVRAVQVVVERVTERAQVTVVANAQASEALGEFFVEARQALGEKLHSLWFNANTARTNAILGDVWEHMAGEPLLRDRVGGAEIFFPPGAFGQANPLLMDSIVEAIHEAVPAHASVIELYAGVGTIGLGLARRGHDIVFNEIGSHSLEGLEYGLGALPDRSRCRVAPGTASEHAELARGADVVIVDPPRKGLDPEVITALVEDPPCRLVYLSCGLDSFLRDVELMKGSRLELREVTAYGLFPYTDHVETLARFESR